ncbi:MAG: Flp family type IVb pilin [Armatimonadota bacterium]
MLRDLWTDEDGLATVEYALVLMLIVVCSAAAWASLGSGTKRSVTVNALALPN